MRKRFDDQRFSLFSRAILSNAFLSLPAFRALFLNCPWSVLCSNASYHSISPHRSPIFCIFRLLHDKVHRQWERKKAAKKKLDTEDGQEYRFDFIAQKPLSQVRVWFSERNDSMHIYIYIYIGINQIHFYLVGIERGTDGHIPYVETSWRNTLEVIGGNT